MRRLNRTGVSTLCGLLMVENVLWDYLGVYLIVTLLFFKGLSERTRNIYVNFLNGSDDSYFNRQEPICFATQSQISTPAVRMFITKYGGDAEESATHPPWLKQQLELVNSIKTRKHKGTHRASWDS